MVQPSFHTFGLDSCLLECVQYLGGNLPATHVGKLLLIVVAWEAIETASANVNQPASAKRAKRVSYTYS